MSLREINDQELLKLAKEKSKAEQASTLDVIRILREVDRRKLYLEFGFGSLHRYVVEELGYDEGSADRRIAAARLTREIPELETKISEGKLSLTNLAQARTFFRREEKLKSEKLTKNQKWEVLTRLEGQSTREAAKTLLKISPEQVVFHESARPVAENLEEWKLIVPAELKARLEKLQSLLSNKIPNATHAELISAIADIALEKLERKSHKESRGKCAHAQGPAHGDGRRAIDDSPPAPEVRGQSLPRNRYVPIGVKREIRRRAEERCEYIDKGTGRRCENRQRLQIHHEIPFGMGGMTTSENLKLFCRPHNTLKAIHDYGQPKMQFHLPYLG